MPPSRLESIVRTLHIRPGQHVLEIGCGHGIAADLICSRLKTGKFLAIDRSKTMVAAAIRRNARHIAAGLAEFQVAALEDFDPRKEKFDTILAVRVGLFHRESQRAAALVAPWLKPGGSIVTVFDEP